MAEPKTQPTKASVSKFLASIDDDGRRRDAKAVCSLMRDITGEKPVLWGDALVGFGTMTYSYASGRTGKWPVVGFSPRKRNLTVYLMDGFDARGDLLGRLGKHSTGKSCLYLTRLDDVDLAVLRELIQVSFTQMQPQRP